MNLRTIVISQESSKLQEPIDIPTIPFGDVNKAPLTPSAMQWTVKAAAEAG